MASGFAGTRLQGAQRLKLGGSRLPRARGAAPPSLTLATGFTLACELLFKKRPHLGGARCPLFLASPPVPSAVTLFFERAAAIRRALFPSLLLLGLHGLG